MLTNTYKFGVVYQKGGQLCEEELFGNAHGSPAFEEFLNVIGEKIQLNGFQVWLRNGMWTGAINGKILSGLSGRPRHLTRTNRPTCSLHRIPRQRSHVPRLNSAALHTGRCTAAAEEATHRKRHRRYCIPGKPVEIFKDFDTPDLYWI